MNTYHFQRRGTASEWIATNPTLAAGELGLETDTVSWKVGDGATAWNSLPYILGRAELVANITWDNGNTDNTIDLSTADIPIANHYIIDCTTADPIYFISNAPDFEFKISIKSDSATALSLGFQSGFNGGEVKLVYPNGGGQANPFNLYNAGLVSLDTNPEYAICKKQSNGTINVEAKSQWRD